MAKCVMIQPPPVKQPAPQYQLTLTQGEAWFLKELLGKYITGRVDNSARLFSTRVYEALDAETSLAGLGDLIARPSNALCLETLWLESQPALIKEFLANE